MYKFKNEDEHAIDIYVNEYIEVEYFCDDMNANFCCTIQSDRIFFLIPWCRKNFKY